MKPTTVMERSDWLRERRKSIGSSEIAACLGICPFATAVDVVARKMNMVEIDDNDDMRIGRSIEDIIIHEAERTFGVKAYPSGILRNEKYPNLHCTPDAVILDPLNDIIGGIEAKNVDPSKIRDWKTVPPNYFVQCQAMLAVTENQEWICTAYFGGSRFKHFIVERSQAIIDEIIRVSIEFMEYVKNGELPKGPSKHCLDEAFFSSDSHGGDVYAPSANDLVILQAYFDQKNRVRNAEERLQELRRQVLQVASGHAAVRLPNGKLIRWTEQKQLKIPSSMY